jgi:hypothetical protein
VINKILLLWIRNDGQYFVLVNENVVISNMAAPSEVLRLCLSGAVLLLLAPDTVSSLPPVIRVGKSI